MLDASALLADLASRLPRQHDSDSLSLENVPPFYLYVDAAFNFSSLLSCQALRRIAHTSKRERLAEVELTRLLEVHPMRTTNASHALLFVVPIWEWVSFLAQDIRGEACARDVPEAWTSHRGRIDKARVALAHSSHYARRGGVDHVFASNAGLEVKADGAHYLVKRLHYSLAHLLQPAIVGRDHAYSLANRNSGVGRCTFELPYASNYHSLSYRPPPAARRRWMLHFRGSVAVCCQPGKSIRKAVAELANASSALQNRTRLVVVARNSTNLARSEEELYRLQGEEMAASDFCLVVAGDNLISSRLYSAIAAACIPVVVGGSAGAFASHVPYDELVLRVDRVAFIQNPHGLLRRLAEVDEAELVARRIALETYLPDVVFEAPGSRAGSNFLRTAFFGCVHARVHTPHLSVFAPGRPLPPHSEYSSPSQHGDLPCVCARAPKMWWVREPAIQVSSSRHRKIGAEGVEAELCRCVHCRAACPAGT